MGMPALFEGKQLDLIRRTVASDTTPAEFEQFIHICRAVNLDPLRRQIYCFVFSKDDAAKRQMTIVTSIGGYRSIADRTGNYRPGPTELVLDPTLIDLDTNPKGISHAVATVYKFSHGDWHPVSETAYWDEFAPIIEEGDGGFEWVDTGKKYPPGHVKAGKPMMRKKQVGEIKPVLDPKKAQWRKMARVMIEKCAEAKALRRAWPDDFAGLEVEDEIDRRASMDLTATELADEAATAHRLEMIGGANAITIDWCNGNHLEREPVGVFGDKAIGYLKANPAMASEFEERNAVSLREYWARDKSGALEVKKAIEAAKAKAAIVDAAE